MTVVFLTNDSCLNGKANSLLPAQMSLTNNIFLFIIQAVQNYFLVTSIIIIFFLLFWRTGIERVYFAHYNKYHMFQCIAQSFINILLTRNRNRHKYISLLITSPIEDSSL